jgi:hypothetical protein
MSQQQKEEREMFMHKQNQEREVFIQVGSRACAVQECPHAAHARPMPSPQTKR